MSMSERVAELVARSRKKISRQEHIGLLDQLIDLYRTLPPVEVESANAIRQAFLLTLEDTPHILMAERFSSLLANQTKPEDFAERQWQTPAAMIAYCELLYSCRFHRSTMTEHIHALQRSLLCYAC
jgi:hypothetical protein